MLFGLEDKDIELITALFPKYGQIEEVYVFGSRAIGSFKDYSDIDLVFFGECSDNFRSRIMAELDELPLPYTFDVVLYTEITSENLKKHIQDHGKILYRRK